VRVYVRLRTASDRYSNATLNSDPLPLSFTSTNVTQNPQHINATASSIPANSQSSNIGIRRTARQSALSENRNCSKFSPKRPDNPIPPALSALDALRKSGSGYLSQNRSPVVRTSDGWRVGEVRTDQLTNRAVTAVPHNTRPGKATARKTVGGLEGKMLPVADSSACA
jgi:hypothetical protein